MLDKNHRAVSIAVFLSRLLQPRYYSLRINRLRYELRSYALLTHLVDPQASGPLLRFESNAVSVEDVTIDTKDGPVPGRLYLPIWRHKTAWHCGIARDSSSWNLRSSIRKLFPRPRHQRVRCPDASACLARRLSRGRRFDTHNRRIARMARATARHRPVTVIALSFLGWAGPLGGLRSAVRPAHASACAVRRIRKSRARRALSRNGSRRISRRPRNPRPGP